jgi:hypothetical protein
MYRTVCALAALVMTAGTVAFATPAQAAAAGEALAAPCGTASMGGPFRLTLHTS